MNFETNSLPYSEGPSGIPMRAYGIAEGYSEENRETYVKVEKKETLVFENPLMRQVLGGGSAALCTDMKGRAWTYLETSFHFAKSIFEGLVLLVRDFAITLFALLPAIFSSQARDALEVHAKLILADIASLPIGMIGFVSPHAGTFLANSALNLFAMTLTSMEKDEREGLLEVGQQFVKKHVGGTLRGMQEKLSGLVKAHGEAEASDKESLGGKIKEHFQEMVDYAHLNAKHLDWGCGMRGLLSEKPSDSVREILQKRAEERRDEEGEDDHRLRGPFTFTGHLGGEDDPIIREPFTLTNNTGHLGGEDDPIIREPFTLTNLSGEHNVDVDDTTLDDIL